MPNKYSLIGGSGHGMVIEIPDNVDSIEVPVYSREQKRVIPGQRQIYTRRRIEKINASGYFPDIALPAGSAELFGLQDLDDNTIASMINTF